MGLIPVSWDAVTVCLSAQAVLKWREYERLFLSSFEHGDDIHLYYNMLSFLFKGKTLERHYGSFYYAYLLAVFTIATNAVYVGVAVLLSETLHDRNYYKQCAIGFSGVIFALKVLTTHLWDRGYRRYFGVRISSKYAVWAELLLIQVMVPNASFMGHLSGIIVGLLYTQGPLRLLMDLPLWLMSSVVQSPSTAPPNVNWGSGISGTREQRSRSRGYGWAVNNDQHVDNDDYDEAVRRSYETLQEEQRQPATGMPQPFDSDEIRRRRLERFSN